MPGHNWGRKGEDYDNSAADGTNLSLDHLDISANTIIGGGGVVGAAYTQTYSTADRTQANLTVGTDIAAFTDPPSAAEMALLRTFVNALKVDLTDVKQITNAIIDDLQAAGISG